MSQCLTCHYYDRKSARAADARGLQWGLCRRDPPHLNSLNAKSHTIEGVWPTVRDDDWCGQWQAQQRPGVAETAVVARPLAQPTLPHRAPADVPTQQGMPLAARNLAHGGAAAIAAGYKPTAGKPPKTA